MKSIRQIQKLTVFSSMIAAISLACLVYIVVASPAYLKKSSEGIPYFTPPVLHPDSGEQITIDELVRHYKAGGS